MQDFMRELTEIHAHNQLVGDYQKTMCLLRALKNGSISIDRITMTADGWTIADEEPAPLVVVNPEAVGE
jgi:hypothetical protein